jgi:hypothetical protein
VFNPQRVAGLPAQRAAALQSFAWIAGEWDHENVVPATRVSPAYSDVGTSRFALGEGGSWICAVAPDGRELPRSPSMPSAGNGSTC